MAGETAALEAAFSRVVRLAGEHAGALDSPARYLAANAWVGGGAAAFGHALSGQRTRLQRAFETAAERIAEAIRAQGGHVTVPPLTTSIAVLSAAGHGSGGSYAGMDVAAMTGLVRALDDAGVSLPAVAHQVALALTEACVPDGSEQDIAAVGQWAAGQAPDLRRRLTVIQQQYDSGLTSAGMAAFGLFGGYAPDRGGVAASLAAAAAGDATGLSAVIAAQRTGEDPTLAARVAAWWRLLAPAAQDHLIATAPNLVGSLNGLPALTRDRANRMFMTEQQATIERRLAQLRSSGHPAGRRTQEFRELDLKLRQIEAVTQSLALGGTQGRPPALLLSLTLGGLGRTAISFGDPDQADTTVTSVPGTGTKLDGIEADVSRAGRLWDEAKSTAQTHKPASILWFEYDAPQLDISEVYADRSVAAPYIAQRGSGALDSFVDGLHAAHEAGSNPRFTVLGHSYGSVLVGVAAQRRPRSFADQLIALGSPGMMASTARQLGVDQVWVGESPHDPVADLGRLPLRGARGPDGRLEPEISLDGPFGTDPSSPGFAAHRFVVQDIPGDLFGTIPYNFPAHSGYWDPGSPSLRNLGFIVNGQYGKVQVIPLPRPRPEPLPPPTPPTAAGDDPMSRPSPSPQPSPEPSGA